ncbi:class E sortase [Agromyces humi]|uniref:class E sortase n=1 Tax=Agromyces humi TaxID=1766800 RepID=UPI001356A840|nr:class E sortase [Agromyces humi]
MRRHRIFTIAGELLLTAGVLVLLYLGWKLWWQDTIAAQQQTAAASAQSEEWIDEFDHSGRTGVDFDKYDPPVGVAPATDQGFAVLYVPRYGADYRRNIAEGFSDQVLDSFDLGIGHYPGTQMPGEVGNFAIAGHRSAYGGAMHWIDQLQPGDPIIVQTADGWYTYRYRSSEIIEPSEIEVVLPVPRQPGVAPVKRTITLTTCDPLYSSEHRWVAYGEFESFSAPNDPPADVEHLVNQ